MPGEIIGLFLHDEIPNGLSPEATCEAIRAQGGLVVVPHPYDRYRKGAIGERCWIGSSRRASWMPLKSSTGG